PRSRDVVPSIVAHRRVAPLPPEEPVGRRRSGSRRGLHLPPRRSARGDRHPRGADAAGEAGLAGVVSSIDLRSDTVTTPTPEMRRAMAEAEVGDDEYGEDPTVNRLQSLVAGLLGTEASLYVPSGTMANQLAIRVLSRPGTEVLCPARSHVYQYELAASPQNSGVQMHPLWDVPDGIVAALEGSTYEFPPISMLTLENTYMVMSGAPT